MKFSKILLLSFACGSLVNTFAYKIPEQSVNSTALSAAYVANSKGADASYYNPANMVFDSKNHELDLNLTYINLSSVKFNTQVPGYSGKSKQEKFLMPTFHYILPSKSEDMAYGLSITTPGGLSKRWDSAFQKTFAQEFSLKIIEVNPTIAYKVNDKFSIGGGLRAIYSEGIVKSEGQVSPGIIAKRDMEGDTVEFGYNLALSYRPTNDLKLAATYRSNVDIKEEGIAKLNRTGLASEFVSEASVQIPLPASLNLAMSYDLNDSLTFEFVFDKTYWSKYKELDFVYKNNLNDPVLKPAFDDPQVKNWKDTNTYRFGLTYKYNDNLTLMGGYAIVKTPIPSSTIGFDLPDSNGKVYSFGTKYKINSNSSFGAAYLLSQKDNRVATVSGVPGEFEDGGVQLFTVNYNYKF